MDSLQLKSEDATESTIPSRHLRSPIFFYCSPEGPPENTPYQHLIICIAEGLSELGIEFFANLDYWRIAPSAEFLFRSHAKVQPDDCSVVVVNEAYCERNGSLPPNLFNSRRRYQTVYIDATDGLRTRAWDPEFRNFDLILRTHVNRNIPYPANFRPWAFGLSNRIIQATAAACASFPRQEVVLNNFRVKHGVRSMACQSFLPLLKPALHVNSATEALQTKGEDPLAQLYWRQTGRRHDTRYYGRLRGARACACFGGDLAYRWPHDINSSLTIIDRVLNRLDLRPKRLVQWDSWRFWESLAAGCVALHLDLKRYGAELPVMPENWTHYIGIEMEDFNAAARRLLNALPNLSQIGGAGRQWAIGHYSPVPTTQRLLALLA